MRGTILVRPAMILGAISITLALGSAALLWNRDGSNELNEKAAWVVLQGVEYRDRGNPTRRPLIRHVGNRYVVLGIPGVGQPNIGTTNPPASLRSWLILNEHSPDGRVHQINTYQRYELSCSFVDSVRSAVGDIDDYVLEYLRTICIPEA